MKRLASVAMTGMMTVSLVAHGGSNMAETTATTATAAAEAETTATAEGAETETAEAPTTGDTTREDLKIGFVYIGDEDEGYTAAHYNGAMEMKGVLGLSDDQTIVKWNISEDEIAKNVAMDLVDQGCQIVFANGSGHESYVIEAAEEYPDVQLCHTTGFQTASSGLSSIYNHLASICEACYVPGIMVGPKLNQTIEDGTVKRSACKIGYVGAYSYAEVTSKYTSFFSGMHPVCQDAAMEVKYTNSWASFDLGKEAADTLTPDGCVLIGQHADTTGAPTVCKAAGVPRVDYNISMIAAVPNQALTSASSNWGVYVTEAVQHVADGTEIPVDWCRGFSDDAVLIAELNETVVAPGTKEKVDKVETKSAPGKLHVFDTSTWAVGGKTLNIYKKDGSDIEYISDEYFYESESGSVPSFNILIDGIITIDN